MKEVFRLLLVSLLVIALCAACQEEPKKARQVAKISLLPDTPPPPPPPPPKDQPPPPKDQPKEVKLEQPKQEAIPQAETLKMEGPAGNAPSAFTAGTPTQEYTGQQLGGNGQPGGSGIGRAEFEVYRTRLQRILQDELSRMKELKGLEYRTPVKVSRATETSAWSVSFPDSTGDAQLDEQLRTALNRLIQKEPPPASAPANGFSVRVTNKFLN